MSDFKCGVHFLEDGITPYHTSDYEEWKLHVANFDHQYNGFSSCTDCGEKNIPHNVTMKLKDKVAPATYCDVCVIRLKEHIGKLEAGKNE